ncbi:hypothetical protein FOPG_10354 [Fusarium oxysporum f. sp. conglutinans race 2 54008]|uniref:Uncharacterized protein n=3 Tax=Fusarium oxysporum TaxID=5507 RepID=A0A2H3SMN1_FUSOX|nr:hypothetical protein FOVG_06545 [Fusarium oxysporum f. sp. pisi HDV247]EXL74615.1 hypothetical protein FOPG_10354 [Fusarium oxysporum f. sp. conglutinans race 2 54008]SCO77421.1 uncharacterized protein FRV6_01633 [Fusarium oxysporum]
MPPVQTMVGMRWSCDKRQGFSVKKQLLLGIQWW